MEILYGASPLPVSPDREVYLARPDFTGAHPVVIVVAGDQGVSPSIKALCRRLARYGYAALALDLFRTAEPESLAAIPPVRIAADLLDLLSVTRDEWSDWCAADRFGVLGLGAGAAAAARLAAERGAALAISPSALEDVAGLLAGLTSPLLAFLSGPGGDVPAVRATVGRGEWVVYGSAGPGFFDDGSEDYDRPAAEDAFRRFIAFLDAWLTRVEV